MMDIMHMLAQFMNIIIHIRNVYKISIETIDDFTDFLIECQYPNELTKYITQNRYLYELLSNEVAITFDLETLSIQESEFYGVLYKGTCQKN